MIFKVSSNSPTETLQLGWTIGSQLKGTEIIFMEGDLGAGKTLLTKGIARSLDIDPYDIVSPTFTLMNEFHYDGGKLYHFDLYRLGPAPVTLPEIDDYMDEGIIIIEWSQYLHPSYFQTSNSIRIKFHLSDQDNDFRNLEISSELDYLNP